MTTDPVTLRTIVVGSGPVGIRFVQELYRHRPDAEILLFGDEPVAPYNRVQLSALLANDVSRDDIDIALPRLSDHPNFEFKACRIASIDRDQQRVTDVDGQTYAYHKLVLATGARAHIPDIEGRNLKGVYTFRNLSDTAALSARIFGAKRIVVIGGGLLGLEASKALLKFGTEVTLVQQGERLMNRQLDEEAARLLRESVEAMGIKTIVGSGIRRILGDESVAAVMTRDGNRIECDTVLFCAGIVPNISLARDTRLAVGRGIQVNDFLQTTDPAIYAVGECCEHDGETYGVVAPGYEQASVAAAHIAGIGEGETPIAYHGSQTISRLKVVGVPVNSMGEVVDLMTRVQQKELRYSNPQENRYRKLVLHRNRIIGAVSVGDWPEFVRIEEAFRSNRNISFWQRMRFRRSGSLWPAGKANDVLSWPASAMICQCNAITQGTIKTVIAGGAQTLTDVQASTGAGTVCGTCKPLVNQMLGSSEPVAPEKTAGFLVAGAVAAVFLVLFFLFQTEAPVATSVQTQGWFEHIWNDKYWKQVTGFTLLGLSLTSLLISMRKRFRLGKLGDFAWWRVAHIVIGLICVAVLFLHTGFHKGINLNQLLLFNFLLVLILGSLASTSIGVGHRLSLDTAGSSRKFSNWLHIGATWPLPILLGVHILTVYYF